MDTINGYALIDLNLLAIRMFKINNVPVVWLGAAKLT
jgi:hypothetical protein